MRINWSQRERIGENHAQSRAGQLKLVEVDQSHNKDLTSLTKLHTQSSPKNCH